ncbi:ABC transporter ATP-binding protein [Amycolatopsis pithecellobii]|uniref:ATP-binding cassette domain-containing protein n=1 Tax=Amycolatopsis pithecellobii TaxID=664692 RepID=A0A6N7Z5L5_9PSEU|nr:ABC transporter ATP-binding protein [Amycolatopsis pithecellobii]MTD57603.1 ATP-binding cassette domain-containing protein [Amycolatopsis pithecellobii]
MTVGKEIPRLSVRGLQVAFRAGKDWVTVVDDVSFSVQGSEVLGLVGESGSGKSLSCLAVMGLAGDSGARIRKGSIQLDGVELVGLSERELENRRGNEIAMVFQEPMTSLNPAFTIGDQIGEVLRRHRSMPRKQARAAAIAVLDRVGIPDATRRVGAYPFEFSGGMQQRAMIAMAIACEPSVLIADEATTALDVTVQAQILDLLRDMRAQLDMAIVFVTHNMGVVADICDRVAVMYAGQIVEEADVRTLFRNPRHPYTEGLLRCTPRLSGRADRLPVIPGSTPLPAEFATGCRFGERCSYHSASCDEPVPLTLSHKDSQVRCVRSAELTLGGGVS